MSDLIACLYIWLGEPCRSALRALAQRLDELLTPPKPHVCEVLPTMPAYARRPLPAHVRARRAPINGHALDIVRPYVRAHERHTTTVTFRECA